MKTSSLNLRNLSLILSVPFLPLSASGQADYSTPYTFTTLAGTASIGSADGTGSAARFYYPSGVAVDSAGNVYVADSLNHTIRKMTPAGEVTTLAGLAGYGSSADGTGSAARFYYPSGVAVDSAGNVYVADAHNHTIRKVTPVGVVTTLAGQAGSSGSADGTGSAARFYYPSGVAVDSAGNVYVADTLNHTIRKVTPAGVVTTLSGRALNPGSADGMGSTVRFNQPSGVAVDSVGNIYVADSYNNAIRKLTPEGVVTTPAGLAGSTGSTDGLGSAARFYNPRSLAMDNKGIVYVADTSNHTIRIGYVSSRPVVIVQSGPGFGFNGGQFGFMLTGPAGQVVVVEASTDLVSWLPIRTNTFAGDPSFGDPQSGAYSTRFYRARTP